MLLIYVLVLLNSPSGIILYHLLVFLGLLVTAGGVFLQWRHTRSEQLTAHLVTLGGVLALRLVLLLLTPVHLQTHSLLGIVSAPLFYATELLSILLLAWAFNWRHWGQPRKLWLHGFIIWCILFLLATLHWYLRAYQTDLLYTDSWHVPLWYTLAALAALGGAFILYHHEGRGRLIAAMLVLLLLGMGSVSGALGTSGLSGGLLAQGEGLARLCYLVGYPLFALALYNIAWRDMEAYREELKGLSNQALRQTQELLFLIEATRFIGQNVGVRSMLRDVVNSVAMALEADLVLVLLPHEEQRGVLRAVARYQVPGRKAAIPRELSLETHSPLATVLQRKEQLLLGTPAQPATEAVLDLSTSASGQGVKTIPTDAAPALLKALHAGPAASLLLQPLLHKDRVLGVLLALRDGTAQPGAEQTGAVSPFGEDHAVWATTIGIHIAAAIENTRLYRAVEAKAQELSALLDVREQELRRQDAILESMAEGILVTNASGHFVLLNEAAEKILRVPRQEVLERPVRELLAQSALHEELPADTLLNLQRTYETVFELDGSYIRVHAAPVLAAQSGDAQTRLGVVSVLQDVTREYQAEQSKREFIASISHELRTPLTAIKGYTELLLSGMGGDLPPTVPRFMRVIQQNTSRMISLVDNVIAVAEIERGQIGLHYEEVALPELIEGVVARYEGLLEERQLAMTLDFPAVEMPVLEADANRLRTVLGNLLDNACKYTYPGGALTMGCRALDGPQGQPVFASFWVADTGVGITLEEQLHIWERFYRVENSLSVDAGGLGIGLTIVKALVEAHGGRVWVDSTPEVGSTFTVLIPLRRGQGWGISPDSSAPSDVMVKL